MKVHLSIQVPTKEQVQALTEDLRSRSKIPGMLIGQCPRQ